MTNSKAIDISSNPHRKRLTDGKPGWSKPKPFVWSKKKNSIESTPYDHCFGDNAEQGLEFDHPDGTIDDQMVSLIKGLSE